MSATRFLKHPFVIIPLVAGVLLPSVAFMLVRWRNQNPAPPSDLDLKDAVVISGKPLPTTELLKLDGKAAPPAELRNGKVLLIFLTTGCGPCKKEFRLLASVETDVSASVKIYGIGVEDKSVIEDFVRENQVKTEILLDSHAQLMKALSVKYFPTSFLVENGVITKTWFGNSASRQQFLEHVGL